MRLTQFFGILLTSLLFAIPTAAWADVPAGEVTIDGADELTARAVKTALKGVGINGTDQAREGRSVLRLFTDPLVGQWWGEWRQTNQPLQWVLSRLDSDVEIPDTSSQSREVGVHVDVTLTGELETPDGALLTTLTGQGSASGTMVEYSSTEVDGYEASTWRNPDDMRRALERQALDQAAQSLASQLAAYRERLVYQRPSQPPDPGSGVAAARQPSMGVPTPPVDFGGWTETVVRVGPNTARMVREWTSVGQPAPILALSDGSVRLWVIQDMPGVDTFKARIPPGQRPTSLGDTYTPPRE